MTIKTIYSTPVFSNVPFYFIFYKIKKNFFEKTPKTKKKPQCINYYLNKKGIAKNPQKIPADIAVPLSSMECFTFFQLTVLVLTKLDFYCHSTLQPQYKQLNSLHCSE